MQGGFGEWVPQLGVLSNLSGCQAHATWQPPAVWTKREVHQSFSLCGHCFCSFLPARKANWLGRRRPAVTKIQLKPQPLKVASCETVHDTLVFMLVIP
jgi:hypothetical protein